MRRVKTNDIAVFENGETVPSIAGVLKVVWERRTGEGQYGPWSMQNAVLKDAEGEVELKIVNHEDISDLKGKEIVLSCWLSEKHGLTGLKVVDKEYKGKVTRQIEVSKTGEIRVLEDELIEDAPQSSPAPRGAPSSPKVASTPAPATKAPLTKAEKVPALPAEKADGELQARRNLNQLANFDLSCCLAADYVRGKLAEIGIEMSQDEFQARWSSYFITGTRENWHKLMPLGNYQFPESTAKKHKASSVETTEAPAEVKKAKAVKAAPAKAAAPVAAPVPADEPPEPWDADEPSVDEMIASGEVQEDDFPF